MPPHFKPVSSLFKPSYTNFRILIGIIGDLLCAELINLYALCYRWKKKKNFIAIIYMPTMFRFLCHS